jgi:hypothetical protein
LLNEDGDLSQPSIDVTLKVRREETKAHVIDDIENNVVEQ